MKEFDYEERYPWFVSSVWYGACHTEAANGLTAGWSSGQTHLSSRN